MIRFGDLPLQSLYRPQPTQIDPTPTVYKKVGRNLGLSIDGRNKMDTPHPNDMVTPVEPDQE